MQGAFFVHENLQSETVSEFVNQMVYTELYEGEMNIEIYCGEW